MSWLDDDREPNACAECRYACDDHCLAGGSSQFVVRFGRAHCPQYRPITLPARVIITPNPSPPRLGVVRVLARRLGELAERLWRWLW